MPDIIVQRANAIRAFNRLYTQTIGILQEGYLETSYPLAAVRIIFELGEREQAIAADLGRDLNLDQGYLSRLVQRLKRDDVIARRPAEHDRRQSVLSLTKHGQAVFDHVNARSEHDFVTLLEAMPERDQRELVNSLQSAGRLLGGPEVHRAPVIVLRDHRPGDMGWVVQAHGAIYAREFGWNMRFEALVAEIVAGFLRAIEPARERCWIAERDGAPVGSVFVVRHTDEIAKLRLLLVDPAVRGHGLGRTLVRECIRFASSSGYQRLMLWTNDILSGAHHIYETEGFALVERTPHSDFGPPMVGETWELLL